MTTKLIQIRAIVREVGRSNPNDPGTDGARLEVITGGPQPLELRNLTQHEVRALAVCLNEEVTITFTTDKKIPGFNEPQ